MERGQPKVLVSQTCWVQQRAQAEFVRKMVRVSCSCFSRITGTVFQGSERQLGVYLLLSSGHTAEPVISIVWPSDLQAAPLRLGQVPAIRQTIKTSWDNTHSF